ncbi:MAG TPA: condensation domain-containing protein, partial [Solirubrobacterales bacterium]|nr:condensation domain-containing protein [Solirubrobacterales bacterium]
MADRESLAPLSVAQEAMWYASRIAPTQLIYNETVSIHKDGPLDAAALRRSFSEIVRRHEALRTTFEVVDGAPVQVVRPAPDFALPVADLSHLTREEAERQAVRTVAAVSRVPYDLRRGPLVRPRLFRFPGEHHRLYLALHHVAFDGVSLARVVLGELAALYDAFAAGLPSPLPDPPTRYVDYARWEQEWIAGPRAARRLDHWVERLTPPPAPALPLDHPRRRCRGSAAARCRCRSRLPRWRACAGSARPAAPRSSRSWSPAGPSCWAATRVARRWSSPPPPNCGSGPSSAPWSAAA